MQKCTTTDDVKTWMAVNKLKLNDNKTEAMMVSSGRKSRSLSSSFPDSLTISSASVPMSDCQKSWCYTWLSIEHENSHAEVCFDCVLVLCFVVGCVLQFGGIHNDWPENVENVQMLLSACFIWWFFQYVCTCFLYFPIWAPQGAARLVHSLPINYFFKEDCTWGIWYVYHHVGLVYDVTDADRWGQMIWTKRRRNRIREKRFFGGVFMYIKMFKKKCFIAFLSKGPRSDSSVRLPIKAHCPIEHVKASTTAVHGTCWIASPPPPTFPAVRLSLSLFYRESNFRQSIVWALVILSV